MLNVQDTAVGKVSTDTEEPIGCRIPYSVFTDDAFYKAEQEHLFRGPTWNFVALEAEVPNPGDFKSTFIGDTPVVVTRDKDQSHHVVVNRCGIGRAWWRERG